MHNWSLCASHAHAPHAPRRIYEMIAFGFELPMLELHMRVHAPHVARTYVAEGTTTYEAVNQGDHAPNKPAVLTDALAAGAWPADLAARTRVVVLTAAGVARRCGTEWPEHKMRGPTGCFEHMHYFAAFELLLADPEVRPHDLALLSDVDEIAKPEVLDELRRCARLQRDQWLYYVLRARLFRHGVHCVGLETWVNGPHAFLVAMLRTWQLTPARLGSTRGQTRQMLHVPDAAWHFTSTGTAAELRRKLTTWGHASMFRERLHPGALDEARLERCMRWCLEAVPVGPAGTPAPPCHNRSSVHDTRMPGALLRRSDLHRVALPRELVEREDRYAWLFYYLE